MPASITPVKVFTDEPYRSIMSLLIEFKEEGLTLKEIHYALSPKGKHYLTYGLMKMETKLDEKIEDLIRSGKFKKYETKSIERKKRRKQNKESLEKERAKLIRNNIRNFLARMKDPKVGAIFKDKGYYKIHTDFSNIGWKIAGIDTFNFYPNEQTLIEECDNTEVKQGLNLGSKVIIQGLHSESLDIKKDDEKFKEIMDNIKKINDAVHELEKIKADRINDMWSFKVEKFCKKTKSKRIKQALEENNWSVRSNIEKLIFANLSGDVTEEEIINVFESERKLIYEMANKKISEKELKGFCKDVFSKEYDFSFSEWKEIVDWRYEVAKWYIHHVPFSITALCFTDFSVNSIIMAQEDTKQIKEK